MDHVARSVYLNRPAPEVWELVGRFQGLPEWHPAVEASHQERIEGIEHRRLGLAGGGEIVERRIDADGTSYAYEILEGPLPVARYRATITVAEAGDGAVVIWASTFDPTDPKAKEVIAGIYETGLEALRRKLEG